MKSILKSTLSAVTIAAMATGATQALAQVTFYENEGFQGRTFYTERQVTNFSQYGFNDRASSVIVLGNRWEVCENAQFNGRCAVLRPGRYPSMASMGLNDRASSVRLINAKTRINEDRYSPPPQQVYDNRRRRNERLYEADVTSVRAVVGPPEQRCWIEKEQVVQPQASQSNVPGAVVGALIGGILGHQVGAGRGNDLATVGGAIAGGAIGATVGRDGHPVQQPTAPSVQRCTTVPSQAAPTLWDVSYNFRGQEHRLQMTSPPGRTVTVNRLGEPRNQYSP